MAWIVRKLVRTAEGDWHEDFFWLVDSHLEATRQAKRVQISDQIAVSITPAPRAPKVEVKNHG